MAAALRTLTEHWQQHFGCTPLLAETFTDPEAHAGTCYKAINWQPVGFSVGYRRHRADFNVPNDRPIKLWLYPRRPDAKALLRAAQLPEAFRLALRTPPSGSVPVKTEQMDSLLELFRHAPDPHAPNIRYRIGPVLTLIALACCAWRCLPCWRPSWKRNPCLKSTSVAKRIPLAASPKHDFKMKDTASNSFLGHMQNPEK